MKIAIIGTRGIPNHYGGFEQFTSKIAPMLVNRGHQVFVYNPSSHPLKKSYWKGVEIVRKYGGEFVGRTLGQFLYDLLCILDTRKRNPDFVLQLGYTSSSIWSFLFPKHACIVTNMDGMEWKRSRYNKLSKLFLLYAEKKAVSHSNILIADSLSISEYLKNKFHKQPVYIPYGATPFSDPDPTVPINYGLTPGDYDLIISRFVPENHLEMIIKGFLQGYATRKLVIVGVDKSTYAKRIVREYSHPMILFRKGIYDNHILNSLRYYSNLYFHGHSVGGTNPSLLEAMACRCLIVANNNVYNKEVLGESAYYFENESDISFLLSIKLIKKEHTDFLEQNIEKLKGTYNWRSILNQMEEEIFKETKGPFVPPSKIYHEHRF